MIALVLVLVLCMAATIVGRQVLAWLKLTPPSRAESIVLSASLGLGIMAHLILGIGLVGLLAPLPVAASLIVLPLLCFRGAGLLVSDWKAPSSEKVQPSSKVVRTLCTALFAVVAALVVVNCFVPPASHEWDAVSYHLAAPKIWIAEGRITFLPTDHHSNFPFLIEMLYLVGLMFEGFASANLFHFVSGALCVAALVVVGNRRFSIPVGWIAGVVFATVPIVVWEAGAAYNEVVFTLYVLLGLFALLDFRESQNPRHLLMCGILMGFALSCKALALVPAFLMAIWILLERARFKNLRWYLAGAVLIGSPYYLKSFVMTGNPVYPFAYRVFGGVYWNQEMSDAYATEQRSFGPNREIERVAEDAQNLSRPNYEKPGILDRARNGFLAPFGLISTPRIYYNMNDPGVGSHLGFLFLALPPLLLLAGRPSRQDASLLAFALAWFGVWTLSMQYTRYIIPLIPIVGLLGASGAVALCRRTPWLKGVIGLAIAAQCLLTLLHFGVAAPEQFWRAADPEATEKFLTRAINTYSSTQWLNKNTDKKDGVVLFEDTRGFYLDRPYLWGNELHSRYIPYPTFADGPEMVDWFLQKGYRYALLNLQFAHQSQSAEGNAKLREAMQTGTLDALLREWYDPKQETGERWRKLLGDALVTGRLQIVSEASSRAAVVLRLRPKP